MAGRLLGNLAVMDPASGEVTGCDMGALVRRLLLFDKYIVDSVRLQEFRHIARHLGYARTRDLLDSGLIGIRNECVQISDMGKSGMFGSPVLPAMHYEFNWLDFHDRKKTTSDHLSELRDVPGVTAKQNIKLRGQIVRLIEPLSLEAKKTFGPSFFEELNSTKLVKQAIRMALSRNSISAPDDFSVKIERLSVSTVRVETDLSKVNGLSVETAHVACQQGLLAVSSLAQRISEMSFYRALSGFQDYEVSLFRTKFDEFAALRLTSEELETDFQRVINVAQLPDYDYERALDIQQLLKVREMDQTRVFRDWLHHGGARTEAEIREMTAGFRNVLSLVLNQPGTKGMRLMATTALGFTPIGPALGVGATIADFILGELFPRPGVTAFIHELYPSLFRT